MAISITNGRLVNWVQLGLVHLWLFLLILILLHAVLLSLRLVRRILRRMTLGLRSRMSIIIIIGGIRLMILIVLRSIMSASSHDLEIFKQSDCILGHITTSAIFSNHTKINRVHLLLRYLPSLIYLARLNHWRPEPSHLLVSEAIVSTTESSHVHVLPLRMTTSPNFFLEEAKELNLNFVFESLKRDLRSLCLSNFIY